MSDIIPALRQHDFPACCHLALEHLGSMVTRANSRGGNAIPGLGIISEEIASKIIDEFVFCVRNSRGKPQRKLTSIQELQLLESLSGFFHHQNSEVVRDTVFRVIFGGEQEEGEGDERGQVLCKLISMAVATSNMNIMNAAASWMQTVGCNSTSVVHLVHTLVADYCVRTSVDLKTGPLRKLPALSALFTCNFVSAVTVLYTPTGSLGRDTPSSDPLPLALLSLITEWLEADPRLYLLSLSSPGNVKTTLWTSPSKSNTQTPIPGLVRWCCTPASVKPVDMVQDEVDSTGHQLSELLSRLHLALLHTIVSFPGLPGASQLELITLSDMHKIIGEVRVRWVEVDRDLSSLGVDRLLQVLQVALATGAFRCSLADLRNVFSAIPSNRLLTMLKQQHLSTAPPQMHNVS